MPKFRKKPTVIEAEQWFPGKAIPGVRFAGPPGELPRHFVMTAHNQVVFLEPGDWVIPEPDGRGYYPCKPDIFAATYEPVDSRDRCGQMVKGEPCALPVGHDAGHKWGSGD